MREKRFTNKGTDDSKFLVRKNIQARRQWNHTVKFWRIKAVNSKTVFHGKGEVKTLPDGRPGLPHENVN